MPRLKVNVISLRHFLGSVILNECERSLRKIGFKIFRYAQDDRINPKLMTLPERRCGGESRRRGP